MNTGQNAQLLVVEDEPKVATFIKKGLQTQSYSVSIAPTGEDAKSLLARTRFDLIILDVNLPDITGLELAEYIRNQPSQVPILMLTALDTVADKLLGFEAGADDYLAKPFDFMELLARVKVLLRRAPTVDEPGRLLRVSDLELDLHERVARRNGQTIDLTAREYALLEYLMRNAGRVVSRVDIAEHVWDIGFDTGTNVIDVYVSYLRAKIDKDSPNKLIHTLIGMGYVLKEK
ncbi:MULTISPECIES: response regulator transcription factor [unclassified Spirosoma]|uniref:response regulator transcription factor n=1 Tax=unclassified Spirosoma TaxID=2621999 RepID=UPI000969C441|nr:MULTISPECIES: response regulator transcription factor [unclassified Spirosoma]MBN8820806.1 response regulator transcription factor [Spirosoma sp.]OJW74566.1 MAG: DNA-binding response regulator [Spirosoma sp. 48-14]